MTLLAGVTLETLEAAIKAAAIQAEQLYLRHPDWDTVEQARLQLNHAYERVHDEVLILRRAGEDTSR